MSIYQIEGNLYNQLVTPREISSKDKPSLEITAQSDGQMILSGYSPELPGFEVSFLGMKHENGTLVGPVLISHPLTKTVSYNQASGKYILKCTLAEMLQGAEIYPPYTLTVILKIGNSRDRLKKTIPVLDLQAHPLKTKTVSSEPAAGSKTAIPDLTLEDFPGYSQARDRYYQGLDYLTAEINKIKNLDEQNEQVLLKKLAKLQRAAAALQRAEKLLRDWNKAGGDSSNQLKIAREAGFGGDEAEFKYRMENADYTKIKWKLAEAEKYIQIYKLALEKKWQKLKIPPEQIAMNVAEVPLNKWEIRAALIDISR